MKFRIMLLLATLLTVSSALATDVKLLWNPIPQQTGVTQVKVNFYRVTVAGTENTSGPVTGFVANTAAAPATSTIDLNVAPGVYFYKITNVGMMVGSTTLKESLLSNEVTAVVPAAIIIMNVPVQLPPQIILH